MLVFTLLFALKTLCLSFLQIPSKDPSALAYGLNPDRFDSQCKIQVLAFPRTASRVNLLCIAVADTSLQISPRSSSDSIVSQYAVLMLMIPWRILIVMNSPLVVAMKGPVLVSP